MAAGKRVAIGFIKAWHHHNHDVPLTASNERLQRQFTSAVAVVGPTIFKEYVRKAAGELGLTRRLVRYTGGSHIEFVAI